MEEDSYPVTVTVTPTGGSGTTLPSATVAVADTPLNWSPNPPTFNWSAVSSSNQNPMFNRPPGQHSAEGASDPDGDGLSFGAVGLPPGPTISTSGLISGAVDYAAAEEGGDSGDDTVTAVVVDGHGNSDHQRFTWTVTDTPRPPVLGDPGDQVSSKPSFSASTLRKS